MTFAPTIADIRNQVMQKLRLDPSDNEMADYWINQAYLDIAQYTGFMTTVQTIVLTPGSYQHLLPVSIQQVRQVQRAAPGQPLSRPAQLVRQEELLSKLNLDSTASGNPDDGGIYYVEGYPILLSHWPVAGANETLKITYAGIPQEVTDATLIQIPEPFGSKILEYGALVEGAKFKKDPLMLDFEQTHALWVDRFVAWLNKRRGRNSQAFEVWDGSFEIDRLEAESEHYGTH